MLRTAKKLAVRGLTKILASAAYELVPRWQLDELPLIRHLRKIFEKYSIDCVLDVGGNLGQYATMLRTRVGFSGRILSFEPVSAYVDILREKSAKDDNWEVIDCALGRTPGEAEINVTRSPGLCSFLQPSTGNMKAFWPEGEVLKVEKVRIMTLDDVVESMRLNIDQTSTYLKLDTQGFDLEVLAGAAAALPKMRALQTEASVQAIYDGMPSYQQTIAYLESAGFQLSGMFPVTTDASLRLVEFDCVAVNNRFANTYSGCEAS